MPKYDYKCNVCQESYVEVHSFKDLSTACPHCSSPEVKKTISLFAARVDRDVRKALTKYADQAIKDNKKFQKDDKFAANVTGADDINHQEKLQKVMREQKAKNEAAQKQIKRLEQ